MMTEKSGEGILPVAWCHLSCDIFGLPNISPCLFHSFTMGTTNIGHEVEGVFGIAVSTMCTYVELWDSPQNLKL